MDKQTPDKMANLIDQEYGDEPIGSEIAEILARVVKAGGYTDPPDDITTVKREVLDIVKEIREVRIGRVS